MNNLQNALNKASTRKTQPKKVEVKAAKESESFLQKRILFYFEKEYRKQYPYCQIVVNPFSSFKMQPYQMNKAKEQGFKASQPDLLFLHPNSKYIGLALELKTLKGNPYLKDGITLKKSSHLANQQKYLDDLYASGYLALFGVGFEHCKEIIDKYFSNT